MQILKGTKRQITMMEWNEVLLKAEKRLADSEECYRRFGDEDSKTFFEEDKAKVEKIKEQIKEVVAFMDAHDIT